MHWSWSISIPTHNKHIWRLQLLPTFRHCTGEFPSIVRLRCIHVRVHVFIRNFKRKNDVTLPWVPFVTHGGQMAIKTTVSSDILSLISSIVKSIFDCCLSSVILIKSYFKHIWTPADSRRVVCQLLAQVCEMSTGELLSLSLPRG